MAVTEALRQEIIIAAVNMTGAVEKDEKGTPDTAGWDARAKVNAMRMTAMFSEQSPISKAINTIDESKKFVTTLAYVGKEPKTKRAFLVFKGATANDQSPEGFETARTEIVDWDGKRGEAYDFAKYCQSLVGQRVFVFIELQEAANGRKVRVLKFLDGMGVDTRFEQADADAAKAFGASKMSR